MFTANRIEHRPLPVVLVSLRVERAPFQLPTYAGVTPRAAWQRNRRLQEQLLSHYESELLRVAPSRADDDGTEPAHNRIPRWPTTVAAGLMLLAVLAWMLATHRWV